MDEMKNSKNNSLIRERQHIMHRMMYQNQKVNNGQSKIDNSKFRLAIWHYLLWKLLCSDCTQ